VVVLVLVAATAIYGLTSRDLAEHFDVPVHPLAVPTDSASIAEGKRLTLIKGCADCHGESLGGGSFSTMPPWAASLHRTSRSAAAGRS
jgi:mono/diheme cytochrome c family protein